MVLYFLDKSITSKVPLIMSLIIFSFSSLKYFMFFFFVGFKPNFLIMYLIWCSVIPVIIDISLIDFEPYFPRTWYEYRVNSLGNDLGNMIS